MPWVKRQKPNRSCKMPNFLQRATTTPEDEWACPRCNKVWVFARQDVFTGEWDIREKNDWQVGCARG